jgi:hypothetical protein
MRNMNSKVNGLYLVTRRSLCWLTLFFIRSCSWYRFGNHKTHVWQSWRARLAHVIVNAEGARMAPSVVAFTKHGERVGLPAKCQFRQHLAFHRLIGQQFNDKEVWDDQVCHTQSWTSASQTYLPITLGLSKLYQKKTDTQLSLPFSPWPSPPSPVRLGPNGKDSYD